jgi:tRNA dimethylallyltransferase
LKNIIVITGPTASGKTGLAIALAKKWNAEILSCDSRQVYSELNIGVARPEPAELEAVKHHFIGHISIHESYSAGRFAREARVFLEHYFQKKETILICGGTGLYLKALFEGLDKQQVDLKIRASLERELAEKGLENLVEELKAYQTDSVQSIDLKNPRRVLRALEWIRQGKKELEPDPWPENWKVTQYAIDWPRPVLYQRTNQRVEEMIKNGLWEEATDCITWKSLNALQTVGYQEIFDAIEGKMNRQEAIEKIKQHTRNFAKRQITWFKKIIDLVWIPAGTQAEMVEAVLRSQGNITG